MRISDWSSDVCSSDLAAFPDHFNAVVSIGYGPLALDYILATGGSGYFRMGFIRSYLEEGRLALVPGSPEFSYSAHVVHSTKADPGVMDRIRAGLRAAAAIAVCRTSYPHRSATDPKPMTPIWVMLLAMSYFPS